MKSFYVYEMKYIGDAIAADNVKLLPFDDKYYSQYERVYNECFYDMRRALDIEPYDFYSDIRQLNGKKKNIFLLMEGETIIGSVGCFGAEIDDLFMCPHYPKELATTKEKFLIRKCNCRKPEPGLIYRAMRKYRIDMSASYMIGDSCTDIEAANAVGLSTVFIGDIKCDLCKKLGDVSPDFIATDIFDAAGGL